MKSMKIQLLPLLAIPMVIAGCSLLPGLDLDVSGEERSSHYQPPGRDADLVANYAPIVAGITPELILEQQRARSNSKGNSVSADYQLMQDYDGEASYKIGPGDSLAIIVYGQPDLTNPTGTTTSPEAAARRVDATGRIFFPYVGDLQVAGMTTAEVRETISKDLAKFYRQPQVDVRVQDYRSKRVQIVGDISQPCLIPITELGLTVTEALAQCQTLSPEQIGGAQQPNASRSISLVRGGQSIDLARPGQGELGDQVYLKAGDQLVVDNRFNRIFLLGEFEQQMVLPMSAGGLTLTDAIVAGAPSIETIDSSEIYVIRGFVNTPNEDGGELTANRRPHIYHLNADYASALVLADQFELRPRDIVYAAPASLVNVNRALAQISPLLNTLFQTAIIYDRTRGR